MAVSDAFINSCQLSFSLPKLGIMEDLKRMFANVDAEVIEEVFLAQNNDMERTVNALLEISGQGTTLSPENTTANISPPMAIADGGTLHTGQGLLHHVGVPNEPLHDTIPQISSFQKTDEQIAQELNQQMEDEEFAMRLQEEDRRNYDLEEEPIGKMILKTTSQIKDTASKTFKTLYGKIQSSLTFSKDTPVSSPYTSLPKHDDEFDDFLEINNHEPPMDVACLTILMPCTERNTGSAAPNTTVDLFASNSFHPK
ncbi:hypothetical protein BATDEDRAFT_26208 [Batrachochytrium dendrobatidis JAM81]|uniref:CUE domain-containing protein n=1 Tax=Batrachochytrium dendrobatidis (strain JAM81 / FGSC 10211) TaxID=684364 RepID=F4P793_BATDJ|nr:uncharacterized protein BATDEDRAFT_26208 [Batrachochytrium dendrobatidis JAM81]EGF78844.1 hypothetical protein BATDEDRAFT_26208 [Batrachochytrium dendrobatidis JAM81]|eukprot:XP_006680338.1 hypothetical protein BATDEDRAFT_26208 [Batrachochytrium dendrobatidis JAM81]